MRLALLTIGLALALGCSDPGDGVARLQKQLGETPVEVTLSRGSLACLAQREKLSRQPALPGAPGLEANRVQVLPRAKGHPVLFLRAPQRPSEPPAEVELLWRQIDGSPGPGWALHKLYKQLHNRPEVARAFLLREGYLYAEDPGLAAALVDLVTLDDLFDAEEIVIQRGRRVMHARRVGDDYELLDGPQQGERAQLWLFDRVWEKGHDPGPPLHVDVSHLAEQHGFRELTVERITRQGIVVDALYGSTWVPSVITMQGADTQLACELVPRERAERVQRARSRAERRQRLVGKLRDVIALMERERLPFDEPRTEEGQQDGNLRPAWRWAYTHGWQTYIFNDDHYRVFDNQGRPKVPQVCVDFITDTLERASGTWWAGEGETRQRTAGGLDFDQLGIDNRRSVERFVNFAWDHPEWFDVYNLASEERIPFHQREAFFEAIHQHRERYIPGDVVTIHGLKSDGEFHYHSFYVVAADPISGVPVLLAANAGRPRVRSWEHEMRSAPRRSIKTRIRPRLEWLERVLDPTESVSAAARPAGAAPG